jgi:hypothetical protein
MAVFVAKLEVKPHPLVVVRTLMCRHPSPFEPPLKRYPRLSGNLLHCNMFG